jgi:hypothetical protein
MTEGFENEAIRDDEEDITAVENVPRYRRMTSQPPSAPFKWLKFIGAILGLIVIVVSVVLWASEAHSGLKDWALSQDAAVKQEVVKETKDQYVKKHEFAKIEQILEGQKEDIDEIKDSQDSIAKKLDKLYELILRSPGRKNSKSNPDQE